MAMIDVISRRFCSTSCGNRNAVAAHRARER
jgi:predicted RNA-binding Zn ribbon-like protein